MLSSVAGYAKGTSAQGELATVRAALARAAAAMQSDPDPLRAFQDASEAEELGRLVSQEFGEFRAWFAAYLNDSRGMSQAQIARELGISPGRVGQLVREGRKKVGSPVTDPGTTQELAPVAVAIIASERGVLIAHRIDERPPWTFPGGELAQGESPAAALERRVLAETGIAIRPTTVFGRRVHPRTNRTMIYMACSPEDDDATPVVGDTEDLDAVEFVGLDTVRQRMPDMYPPVQAHLEAVLGNLEKF